MTWNPLSPKLNFGIEHGALGAAYTALLWISVEPFGFRWFVIGMLAFLVIVTTKETLWDPANESEQPFLWSGATDLFFYLVGIGVALSVMFL